MNPYWFELLHSWRSLGREGFTIPFILGSQQFFHGEIDTQGIEDLIVDIVENSPEEIYLKYCFTTEDLVLGIRDEKRKIIPGYFPLYKGKIQQNFFITSFSKDLGNDIESVIDKLTDKYEYFIENGQFSMNEGERGDFTGSEKEFIRSCFS